MNFVLASRSPQRREILAAEGFEFEVVGADVEELTRGDPRRVAVENAVRKAEAVYDRHPDAVVLGADTVVALEERMLPKPADAAEAAEWLRALSGRTHTVLTGVCIRAPEGQFSSGDDTSVTFRALSEADIDAYVATGEWRERAGGYAIQGAGGGLVESIDGPHDNVVGLPMATVRRLLGLRGNPG